MELEGRGQRSPEGVGCDQSLGLGVPGMDHGLHDHLLDIGQGPGAVAIEVRVVGGYVGLHSGSGLNLAQRFTLISWG